MNERDHVLNAVVLAVGMAVVVAPGLDEQTARTALQIGIPIVVGALVPDLDATIGDHRKTFHNLLTLGTFAAFPFVFGNLFYVWIGVATHFALDLLGNVRGLAFFYPYPREFDVPWGVTVDSPWATVVTLAVTGLEIAIFQAVVATPLSVGPVYAGLFPV